MRISIEKLSYEGKHHENTLNNRDLEMITDPLPHNRLWVIDQNCKSICKQQNYQFLLANGG